MPDNYELVQDLARTRSALRVALRIGETLQARVDAAIEFAARSESAERYAPIVAVLRGKT